MPRRVSKIICKVLSAVSGSDSDWITFSLLNWLCGGFVPILRLHWTRSWGTSVWAVWAGLKTPLEPKHVEIVVLQPVKVKMKPKVWRRSEQVQRSCVFSFKRTALVFALMDQIRTLKTPFSASFPLSLSPPTLLVPYVFAWCAWWIVQHEPWESLEFCFYVFHISWHDGRFVSSQI